MTISDSGQQATVTDAAEGPVENLSTTAPLAAEAMAPSNDSSADAAAAAAGRRILIGSQRDPAAYRARTKRDWTPIEEEGRKAEGGRRRKRGGRKGERGEGRGDRAAGQRDQQGLGGSPPSKLIESAGESSAVLSTQAAGLGAQAPEPAAGDISKFPNLQISKSEIRNPKSEIEDPKSQIPSPLAPRPSSPAPDLDVDAELSRAMDGASMDELLGGDGQGQEALEPESLHGGRVVGVRRDDVFVEFAGREQGVLSLRQFDVPPSPGAAIQVVVQRFNPEDGLYDLSLPNKAVQVDDWSDLIEGALVDVRVTGHNTGGLECEAGQIRGFIPVSQVSLYRVEDLAAYVDQRLTCVITEADPQRRNLVLSRRAVLEREREQARQQMLNSLCPGQVFDGVVRKLMDFGAFVDLGHGVDGLVHVSQVAWARVKHPSDVLKEGQAIKVRIEKVDPDTGKISLAYRDLLESPWTAAAQKYPPNSVVGGTVTKLMPFGAFVELEPGIEGLVHVSELSHKRVWRPADVVKEGQQVEVFVLSIDAAARRISLSMKACAAPPEPAKKDEAEEAAPAKASKKHAKPSGPLLGGLSRRTGDRFGLKW